MSYKSKKAQGLSLTFKEEFDLSKLFISSYSDNKININMEDEIIAKTLVK